MKWIRKTADNGDTTAQYALAICYAEGHGVKQDVSEVVKWLRKAAEQGFVDAQFKLAQGYATGELGLPTDYTESAKWLELAAKQGHVEAQYMLGCYYKYGYGVEKSAEQADFWFRKVAEQGYKLPEEALKNNKE